MSSQSPNDTERSLPTHGYWNALRSLADENNQDSKIEWDNLTSIGIGPHRGVCWACRIYRLPPSFD